MDWTQTRVHSRIGYKVFRRPRRHKNVKRIDMTSFIEESQLIDLSTRHYLKTNPHRVLKFKDFVREVIDTMPTKTLRENKAKIKKCLEQLELQF